MVALPRPLATCCTPDQIKIFRFFLEPLSHAPGVVWRPGAQWASQNSQVLLYWCLSDPLGSTASSPKVPLRNAQSLSRATACAYRIPHGSTQHLRHDVLRALASRRPRHTGCGRRTWPTARTPVVWKPTRESQPRRFDFPWQPRSCATACAHGEPSTCSGRLRASGTYAGVGEVTAVYIAHRLV